MSNLSTPVIEYFISILEKIIKQYKRNQKLFKSDSNDEDTNDEDEKFEPDYVATEKDPRLYNALFELELHYKTNVIPQEHIEVFNELAPIITECEFESWFMNEHEIYKDESEFTHENFMKEYPFMKDRDSYGGNGAYRFNSLESNIFKHIMLRISTQNTLFKKNN